MIPAMADELDRAVAALERWLKDAGMGLADVFGPPATDAEVAEVETALGRKLPDDYRRFLTTVGGQRFISTGEEEGYLAQLVQNLELLGPAHAHGEWQTMVEEWGDEGPGPIAAEGPVKPLYKHALWWPITCILGSSQYHCLDLDPAAGGAVGQVIWMADDDEERRVVAPSFGAFLVMLAEALDGAEPAEEGAELTDEAFDRLLGL
jgi:cell wall assembly regulator SMI1